MKNQWKVLTLLILFSSCAINKYTEESLFKTKAYCGKFVSIKKGEKVSTIQTSKLVLTIKGNPDIPTGSFCYIRREICRQSVTPPIKKKLEHKYFSWGNSKEYRIKGKVPVSLFYLRSF